MKKNIFLFLGIVSLLLASCHFEKPIVLNDILVETQVLMTSEEFLFDQFGASGRFAMNDDKPVSESALLDLGMKEFKESVDLLDYYFSKYRFKRDELFVKEYYEDVFRNEIKEYYEFLRGGYTEIKTVAVAEEDFLAFYNDLSGRSLVFFDKLNLQLDALMRALYSVGFLLLE